MVQALRVDSLLQLQTLAFGTASKTAALGNEGAFC